MRIDEFKIAVDADVKITEFAPKIFRQIRRRHVSEQLMLDSFLPIVNFKGIHTLDIGTGKSPSFFFFTDN